MRIIYLRQFEKRYLYLTEKLQSRFKERLKLLLKEPHHPLLNNHDVGKAFPGYRSMNVTGDYRAIFKIEEGSVIFSRIGRHAELYK